MIFRYLASFILATFFALQMPSLALAQTWRPLCVNGGATTGAHNNTWQRLNTPSTGGGTWKKVGGCVPPPPPPPPADPYQYNIYAQYSKIPAGYGRVGYVDPRMQGGGGTITPNPIGDYHIFMLDTGKYSGSLQLWIYGSWPRNKISAIKLDGVVIPVSEAKAYYVWKPNPEYNGDVTYWQWDPKYGINWTENTWHTMSIIP